MRSGAKLRAVPLVAAVVFLITGCGSADAAGTTPAGGTLTVAVTSDPQCLDPQQAGSSDAITVTRQFVDSLTDHDPDSGKLSGWLATSWEVDPQVTSFTFHLREDATFSDGTPVDAQAVKDNLDGLIKLGARAVQASTYLSGYRETVVVDPHTARVEFSKPNAQFLKATSTTSLGLVAASSLAQPAADRCAKGIVGSGPFLLDQYTRNQQVVQRRRTGYAWSPERMANRGAAYLDRLVFKIVPEVNVRVGLLESGQADAVLGVGPQDTDRVKRAGLVLSSRPNPGLVYGINANRSRPLVADGSVTRAIQRAIDRQQVIDTILSPDYHAATSVLSSPTPGYVDLSGALSADAAAATAILTTAGWVPGPDGVRVRDGQRLSLVVRYYTPDSGLAESSLALIQQQLRKVGVDVALKPTPITQAIQTFKDGDYDLIWGNASAADPDILRNYFTVQGLNVVRLTAGPLQDALYAQAVEGDPGRRAQQVALAQRLLVEEGYAVPVYEPTTVVGLSAKVHGVRFDSASRLQFVDVRRS
ncbi:ABC transporter substrate-binding protein [Dactylosporangium sp. NPDC000555]|uniref:ABC transporter substrate-binding protein n=1 Tax=Dactylosporangium sp. NPDC000555 TaxID=3154260 RepID=UPI00332F40DD